MVFFLIGAYKKTKTFKNNKKKLTHRYQTIGTFVMLNIMTIFLFSLMFFFDELATKRHHILNIYICTVKKETK